LWRWPSHEIPPSTTTFSDSEPQRDNQVDYSLDEYIAYLNEFVYNGNGYVTTG
jgi:hypothetical protein